MTFCMEFSTILVYKMHLNCEITGGREAVMVKERAYAKINLGLDVLRKRPDGYHEVKMIMQTVNICDELTLEKREEPGIALRIEGAGLPADETNLAYRAAALLAEKKELGEGVSITLKKLGVTLGADVPYCIEGGTMLSEGIGEILTPLSPPPPCHLVVAKPDIDVSTAFVYGHLRADKLSFHPDIDGMADALFRGDLKGITDRLGNVLETVTEREYPVIGRLKQKMRGTGAENALMSGSGPTVFGIYTDPEKAKKGALAIEEERLAEAVFVTEFYAI